MDRRSMDTRHITCGARRVALRYGMSATLNSETATTPLRTSLFLFSLLFLGLPSPSIDACNSPQCSSDPTTRRKARTRDHGRDRERLKQSLGMASVHGQG